MYSEYDIQALPVVQAIASACGTTATEHEYCSTKYQILVPGICNIYGVSIRMKGNDVNPYQSFWAGSARLQQ